MREPMTLFEQSNRGRLFASRTIHYPPFHIFSNNTHTNYVKPKFRSLDDPLIRDMMATGKSMLPNSGRDQLIEISLSPSDRDIDHDENRGRRKRKRPSYRKSNFHSFSSSPSQIELAQLTARGTRTEFRTVMPAVRHDDTVHFQHHQVPPPTPSNYEIKQVTFESQDKIQSRSSTQKLPKRKERPTAIHLPALNLSPLSRHTPINLSAKEVRSNLSNYLQNYY